MKYLITIALFLLSVIVNAQKIIQRSSGTATVEDVRLIAKTNLIIPRYADTTEANLPGNIGLDSVGAIIFTRTDQNEWIRKENPKRWALNGTTSSSSNLPMHATNADAIAANLNNGDFYYTPYNNGNYFVAIVIRSITNFLLNEDTTRILNENGTFLIIE